MFARTKRHTAVWEPSSFNGVGPIGNVFQKQQENYQLLCFLCLLTSSTPLAPFSGSKVIVGWTEWSQRQPQGGLCPPLVQNGILKVESWTLQEMPVQSRDPPSISSPPHCTEASPMTFLTDTPWNSCFPTVQFSPVDHWSSQKEGMFRTPPICSLSWGWRWGKCQGGS